MVYLPPSHLKKTLSVNSPLNSTLKRWLTRSHCVLEQALSDTDTPPRLAEAMRYSALANGKRIRALLVYAAGLAVNAPLARLDSVAAAIECIHAYSLIHDDLPAMDNDDLRRGKPTSHIKFDEATAILAGDALQTIAFELVCDEASELSDRQSRDISLKLALCAGRSGMVGGQMLDLLATNQKLDRFQLEDVHRRKTGALISAAVVCGALCGDNLSKNQYRNLQQYADKIGLAFQVMDDVLDIESSTEQLGKTSGADQVKGKSTYPGLIGLSASKQFAQTLYQEAVASIAKIGDNSEHLIELASLVVNRAH